ncbi:MAG: chalcone isomerase family protein [Deltaproteobacteria bacterium]|nr:chalcone isomerase family protein [Deltaproteobacteria bacterium]
MSRPLFLVACVAVCALAPWVQATACYARTVEGVDFAESTSAAGATVNLIGVGIRTKWMTNVYAMGVYSANAKKSSAHIVNADEPKLLWLHMLRGIGGDKMRDAIDDGLEKNTGEADRAKLQADIDRVKAAFPASIGKGLVIQFAYSPAKGTTLKIGGSEKVTVPGKAFMVAMWSIWFGSRPADKDLRDAVLGN